MGKSLKKSKGLDQEADTLKWWVVVTEFYCKDLDKDRWFLLEEGNKQENNLIPWNIQGREDNSTSLS